MNDLACWVSLGENVIMSPLCRAMASCLPLGDQETMKKINENKFLSESFKRTAGWESLRRPPATPSSNGLQGRHVDYLDKLAVGASIWFAKNCNKFGNVPRICVHLTDRSRSWSGWQEGM